MIGGTAGVAVTQLGEAGITECRRQTSFIDCTLDLNSHTIGAASGSRVQSD